MAKTKLQTIEAMLGQLSLEEIRELRQTLQDLEDAIKTRLEAAKNDEQLTDSLALHPTQGYIEHKWIPNKDHTRKNGPYSYLRVWRNGKHTSKYIGKGKPKP